MKELMPAISSFRTIVENNGLYVDKTHYLLRMVKDVNHLFVLPSPKGFGKSLMLDTLENIFKGNKELFKGTYIYDKYDFEPFPIIKICFKEIDTSSVEAFHKGLKNKIISIAKDYGIEEKDLDLDFEYPPHWLLELLRKMQAKLNKDIVILFDDYDYPYLSFMDTKDCKKIDSEMSHFYNTFKDMPGIEFCFFTCTVRYSYPSLASNFLEWLHYLPNQYDYVDLIGYTDEEVDYYFSPYFEKYYEDNNITEDEEKKAFREKIREYYGGHRLSLHNHKRTFYNPTSIALFINNGCRFEYYWPHYGRDAIADKLINEDPYLLKESIRFFTSISDVLFFTDFDWKKKRLSDVYAYLFHAGYLTQSTERTYLSYLDFPNKEIKESIKIIIPDLQ